MELKLKTLTPICTGDVEMKGFEVKETGLMGSVRWWYEALVRGGGGWACDPSEHSCPDKDKKYCQACQTFGATGSRRLFRLIEEDKDLRDAQPCEFKRFNIAGRPRGWNFTGGKEGSLSLKIIPLDYRFDPKIIVGLIGFMVKNAALGARTQLGYGISCFEDGEPDYGSLKTHLASLPNTTRVIPGLPDFTQMLFCTVQLQGKAVKPLDRMADFKYELRDEFRSGSITKHLTNQGAIKTLRYFLLGTTKKWIYKGVEEEKMASKINVSRVFPDDGHYFMRIWGWVPEPPVSGITRDQIISMIEGIVKKFGNIIRWREKDNLRKRCVPVCTSPCKTPKEFLECLLR